MRILKIRVCSECPHHDPPTPIYPGYCSITRHESGFMGNPFEDYPKIPDWCPLEKSEPDELPEWFVERVNGIIKAAHEELDKDPAGNFLSGRTEEAIRQIDLVKWLISFRRDDEDCPVKTALQQTHMSEP